MFKVWKTSQRSCLYLLSNFHKFCFFTAEVDFEKNKIIIPDLSADHHNPSAESEKALG
jgi:hypothetical protein